MADFAAVLDAFRTPDALVERVPSAALIALGELYDAVNNLNSPYPDERTTQDQYDAAIAQARRVLGIES